MIFVLSEVFSLTFSAKRHRQSFNVKQVPWDTTFPNALTADTLSFTAIPAVTETVPTVRPLAKKSGWINAGRKSLILLTSMWFLLCLTN